MKIVALLSWYDEPPAWLAATVTSLTKLGVAHVVAIDGAYATFPDGAARSSPDQAEALTLAADAAGMGLTLVRPRTVWIDEVVKRAELFRHGCASAEPGDWLLAIDADEVISEVVDAAGVHRELAATDALVVRAELWSHQPPQTPEQEEVARYLPFAGEPARALQSRLFRAVDHMTVEHNHHHYVGEHDGIRYALRSDRLGAALGYAMPPTIDLPDIRIEHREYERRARRRRLKADYYATRDRLGLEAQTVDDIAR